MLKYLNINKNIKNLKYTLHNILTFKFYNRLIMLCFVYQNLNFYYIQLETTNLLTKFTSCTVLQST